MPKYTFTFKKDDVFLEYITTDKESMERQFQIWVTCASVWAYNQEKIEKGLMVAPLPKAEKPVNSEVEEVKPVEEKLEEPVQAPEIREEATELIIENSEQSQIDRESQRIIQEYKAEMEEIGRAHV